jgi:hypothetical protein
MNRPVICRDPWVRWQMSEIIHWIIVSGCFGLVAFGLAGFFRGLSLPANEHRVSGRGKDLYRDWQR